MLFACCCEHKTSIALYFENKCCGFCTSVMHVSCEMNCRGPVTFEQSWLWGLQVPSNTKTKLFAKFATTPACGSDGAALDPYKVRVVAVLYITYCSAPQG